MKSHEEILNNLLKPELSIGFSRIIYLKYFSKLIKAMNLAAEQAFYQARAEIEAEPDSVDEYNGYWKQKHETFEDYLKELNDDNK